MQQRFHDTIHVFVVVIDKHKRPLRGGGGGGEGRIFSKIRHWFVEYRGFVYEFGKAGDQELDINNPNYKYGPGGEKVVDE